MDAQRLILVTGATGNVGRQVVLQLLNRGMRVRALSRNPGSAHLPDGLEVVRGDLSIPDTLNGCLGGVEDVFLVWRSPNAGAAPAVVDRVSRHARRIVFLSSSAIRDDLEPQPNEVAKMHAGIEHAIER